MTVLIVLTAALVLVVVTGSERMRLRHIFVAPKSVSAVPHHLVPVSAPQLADVADVLALCLATGADIRSALEAMRGVPSPVTASIERTLALLNVGVDLSAAWTHWGSAAAPLVNAFERSGRTGAPLADECRRVAADLRDERLAAVQQQARRVGVRAVLPLMTCFLPAFILVGVIPVIAGLIGAMFAST